MVASLVGYLEFGVMGLGKEIIFIWSMLELRFELLEEYLTCFFKNSGTLPPVIHQKFKK